jgi:hypothetical protein
MECISASIWRLAAGNLASGNRLSPSPRRLLSTIGRCNRFIVLRPISKSEIALITISQGLISGEPTPNGSRNAVGAGATIQRLRNSPAELSRRIGKAKSQPRLAGTRLFLSVAESSEICQSQLANVEVLIIQKN